MIEILKKVPVDKNGEVVYLMPGDKPDWLSESVVGSLLRGGDAKIVKQKAVDKEEKSTRSTKESKRKLRTK